MKSTGVVRKMDDLGRIVLPIEIRKMMEIGEKDAVEIFTDGDKIILRKYQMNEVIHEIKRIDKDAFVSVSAANSVYGEGFEEIKPGLSLKKKKIENPKTE